MNGITKVIIHILGGFIPELSLAYIVMKLVGGDWLVFLITYIAIQMFYLIVWLFRSLVNWLFYTVLWRKQLIEGIYKNLTLRQYPNKGYYLSYPFDAETYFLEIVGQTTASCRN